MLGCSSLMNFLMDRCLSIATTLMSLSSSCFSSPFMKLTGSIAMDLVAWDTYGEQLYSSWHESSMKEYVVYLHEWPGSILRFDVFECVIQLVFSKSQNICGCLLWIILSVWMKISPMLSAADVSRQWLGSSFKFAIAKFTSVTNWMDFKKMLHVQELLKLCMELMTSDKTSREIFASWDATLQVTIFRITHSSHNRRWCITSSHWGMSVTQLCSISGLEGLAE